MLHKVPQSLEEGEYFSAHSMRPALPWYVMQTLQTSIRQEQNELEHLNKSNPTTCEMGTAS